MTNEKVDAVVLAAIQSGKTRAGAVQENLRRAGFGVHLGSSYAAQRATGRSLQRLRRRGRIEYVKKIGWRPSKEQT